MNHPGIDTWPGSTTGEGVASARHHEVVILGAGFAGIGAAIMLRRADIDFVVLEKARSVGGVWRENTYPDCACDVPSAFYCYSFAPNPAWSHLFAKQPEIKRYAEDTVARTGIDDAIRFGHELQAARWNASSALWELETCAGPYTARFIIVATGPMHEPVTPALPGLETFRGERFHSAHWDHGVDLRGKRVAVIGTGASAIQFVPAIQPLAASLTVFQRSAPWVLPKLDARISARWQRRFARFPVLQSALRGLLSLQFELLNGSVQRPRARRRLERAALRNIHSAVRDPALRARLTPDFDIGCKRILQSNSWYPALAQPNVTVSSDVKEVRGNTLIAGDGSVREADVIIFGTGFKVAEPPIAARITGASGRTLADLWNGSPEAYLGTTVPDCPNCFFTLGPNLYAFSSAFVMIEAQVEYILGALRHARKNGLRSLRPREAVVADYNHDLQGALQQSVFNIGGCSSYFIDRNGRNSTNWPWSIRELRRRLRRFDAAAYEAEPQP
jgi:cation diffusion facilitator CzcD-associated flavoprotein CzcO